MARAYSAEYRSTLASTSAHEAPLTLLEISHPGLTEPIRVVNDNDNIISNGHTFVACGFRCYLPDDMDNKMPTAQLAVDNVGREMMYWIESSGGGAGTTVRFIQLMRSRPDLIEWEITMGLTNIKVTSKEVTGDLGYENIFGRPAITMRNDPFTMPGIF